MLLRNSEKTIDVKKSFTDDEYLNLLSDSSIIDGKFSAINFDFEEYEWKLLENQYFPTSIDVDK